MNALPKTPSGVLIAGTHSGVGKSSITMGLLRLLCRRGIRTCPFKAGPDYIDPQHHVRACGRPSYNLDAWMSSPEAVRDLFFDVLGDDGFAVVEGVMGLYDGVRPTDDEGSSAALSKWLGLPVVLVFDGHAMARSGAALVKGFQTLDPEVRILGVIANRVNSAGHADLLREAIEGETGIPLLGHVPSDRRIEIPSRHLGLLQGSEQEEALYERWADHLEKHLDVGRLLASCPVLGRPSGYAEKQTEAESRPFQVAVARDEAFQFVYQETLDFFRRQGGEVVFFSPLADPALPENTDWVYIPGGYPELHCDALAGNRPLREEILRRARGGLPIVGECGGLMWLGKELVDEKGRRHSMTGVFDFVTTLESKSMTLGYRELKGAIPDLPGEPLILRGHEFHYSRFEENPETPLFRWEVAERGRQGRDGYRKGNSFAFYSHLYWPASPRWLSFLLGRIPETKRTVFNLEKG